MPANKKYLAKSPWTKSSKLLAAILGGFLVSIGIHFVLALWLDMRTVMVTSVFSIFILWAILMLLVYWMKSPGKAWAIILLTLIICGAAIYFGKMNI